MGHVEIRGWFVPVHEPLDVISLPRVFGFPQIVRKLRDLSSNQGVERVLRQALHVVRERVDQVFLETLKMLVQQELQVLAQHQMAPVVPTCRLSPIAQQIIVALVFGRMQKFIPQCLQSRKQRRIDLEEVVKVRRWK